MLRCDAMRGGDGVVNSVPRSVVCTVVVPSPGFLFFAIVAVEIRRIRLEVRVDGEKQNNTETKDKVKRYALHVATDMFRVPFTREPGTVVLRYPDLCKQLHSFV